MEFMAIGTLKGEVHTFRHDLESFFYIFLWVSVNYPLGHADPPKRERKRKTALDLWGSTFEHAKLVKWGDMGRRGGVGGWS